MKHHPNVSENNGMVTLKKGLFDRMLAKKYEEGYYNGRKDGHENAIRLFKSMSLFDRMFKRFDNED